MPRLDSEGRFPWDPEHSGRPELKTVNFLPWPENKLMAIRVFLVFAVAATIIVLTVGVP